MERWGWCGICLMMETHNNLSCSHAWYKVNELPHPQPSLPPQFESPLTLPCDVNPRPYSPSVIAALNHSKLEVNQPRVGWMEMDAQEKCDLNHSGYGLPALEAWKIALSLPLSLSFSFYLSLSTSLSSLRHTVYFMLWDTLQRNKNWWTQFPFFYTSKEELSQKDHPS